MQRKKFVLFFRLIMATTPKLDPSTLLANLHWRYATKVFDAGKTISPEVWKALEETLVLTPSSYGLQPWKFIVLTDKEIRAKLLSHSWGQAQVTDCSHYVVFATLKKIAEADIDKFLARIAAVRGVEVDTLQTYRGMMIGDVVKGPRGQISGEWATRQAYIALGNFMTAAALLQVDTCPMEGFIPAEYDKILGLEARGLTASVCCAAGYRSEKDKYAQLPKVRFSTDEVVEHV
jgi:nitroreductase